MDVWVGGWMDDDTSFQNFPFQASQRSFRLIKLSLPYSEVSKFGMK